MALKFSRRFKRNLLALLFSGFVLGLLFCWHLGGTLCAPANRPISLPAGLPVEPVTFASTSGTTVHGWLLTPATNKGVVILQHGVRGDRNGMLARARFLYAAGYGVLLFDFQAHGESPGKVITFGYLESRDSQAAVAFAKQRFPGQPVGVIGCSLGGAAVLLAEPPLEVQAVVLESVFPTIVDATKDRLEWTIGRPARLLSPLLTSQLRFRCALGPDDLRPIEHVADVKVPKLFLAGTKDQRTHFAEAQALFDRAAEPKQFVPVEGADHEDLHNYLGARYERLILDFLEEHLK